MQIKTFGTKSIRWNATFCFLILGFFLLEPSQAQPGGNIRFDRFAIEQGLSQRTIHSILQDKQGFMWFATQEGLNKYDGYQFTAYLADPKDEAGLSNDYIRAISQDSVGNLWIGSN
ncbi:MAG: hypothetical protein GY861_02020 [bacterium]|nr:hypothetical protein [bacterium]